MLIKFLEIEGTSKWQKSMANMRNEQSLTIVNNEMNNTFLFLFEIHILDIFGQMMGGSTVQIPIIINISFKVSHTSYSRSTSINSKVIVSSKGRMKVWWHATEVVIIIITLMWKSKTIKVSKIGWFLFFAFTKIPWIRT